MPVIGVTHCRKLEDYRQAVLHVGGEVRILEPSISVEDALAGIDGLLLTGGEDIGPALYGEEVHPAVVDVEPARDEFEIALVQAARSRQLPVLAICRGIQVLNVACGGTLVQDIEDQVGTTVNHALREPPHAMAHDVWVASGSLLESLMRERLDGDTCAVNSRQHQAPDARGKGLVASATAPDGVIEAIEDPSKRFCLGVQWHPENFYRTGEFRALFEGLVNAAKGVR
jgi:putative glutamine amidotransferase